MEGASVLQMTATENSTQQHTKKERAQQWKAEHTITLPRQNSRLKPKKTILTNLHYDLDYNNLIKKLPTKKDSRKILKLRANENILLIMPASRPQELKYVLPVFMQVARKLQQKYPNLIVYIPSCREVFDSKFKLALDKYKVKGKVVSQKDIEELKTYIYSLTKLALCKSGTVNMELALYGIPQIVGYRVSRVTAFIAKKILNFKVKFISPVNLLVKKLIIPEFVQKEFEVKKIYEKACRVIDRKSEKEKISKGYAYLKKELGQEGVVKRAAEEIINSLIWCL